MKLIRCYIENFGKLSQFEYEFREGLNTIEEENGWGKTTFAAFIKAMFFGLEYKRGNSITDRKRYMPWNGKKFGGNLTFEVEGKPYKIERFFGKRDKDDTFMLYDLTTNIPSQDFSENIGEKIWKVDRDSYEKTAFITLSDMELVNDIISSKLGDIDEQEADMERTSMALDILDKLALEIKPKRGKNGFLGKKEAEIKELRKEYKTCQDSLHEIEIKEEWIRKKEDELKKLHNKIQEIDKEQDKFALYEKKKHYDFIIKEYQTAAEDVKKVESFFKGNSLSKSEMNQLEEAVDEYSNLKRNVISKQLTEEQKGQLDELSLRFQNGYPSVDEQNRCSKNLKELSAEGIKQNGFVVSGEKQSDFYTLSQKYEAVSSDPVAIDELIKNYQQVVQLDKQAGEIKSDLERLEREASDQKEAESKKKVFPFMPVGIGLLVIGAVLLWEIVALGVAFFVCGVFLVLLSLFRKKGDKETKSILEERNKDRNLCANKLTDVMKRRDKLESTYLTFLQKLGKKNENILVELSNVRGECQEYHRLKKELEEKEKNYKAIGEHISLLEDELKEFYSQYGFYQVTDYEEAFHELRKKVTQFQELKRQELEHQNLKNIIEEKEGYLTPVFHRYFGEFPDTVKTAVLEIREQLTKLEEKKEAFKKATDRMLEFEKKNNVEELQLIHLPEKSAEELKVQKDAYMVQKDGIINEISNYQKDISGLSLKVDKMEDMESLILKNNEELTELQKQWNLLNLTKQCLVEAKEELAAKYMGEMSSSFDRYMNKMDPQRDARYQIDIKLNVMLEKEGQLHDSTGLSKGMKDLVQICMRIALVEAIYKEVYKPILILDDPLVNLDSERMERATKLLRSIGEEYQMIYFICHDSRRAE